MRQCHFLDNSTKNISRMVPANWVFGHLMCLSSANTMVFFGKDYAKRSWVWYNISIFPEVDLAFGLRKTESQDLKYVKYHG